MFHVELMSKLKKHKVLKASDHLVSGEFFNIYWDNEKKRAWTDLDHLDSLDPYYESNDYVSHHDKARSWIQKLYVRARGLMLNYKHLILKKQIKPKSRLLDIGCGTGAYLSFMKTKGFQVDGVENNSKARRICNENHLNVQADEKSFDPNSFDLITLWHVLEHLPNPEKSVLTYHQLLKKEGLLIIAVPNFESHDRFYYQEDWAALDVPRHRWHFTPRGLIKTIEEIGFERIKTKALTLDVFYICYLSEKYRGKSIPFIRGMIKGLFFSLKSLFTFRHSSLVFVFRKRAL